MSNIPNNAQFLDVYFPIVDGVVRTVHNYATLMNKDCFSCVIVPDMKSDYVDDFPYRVLRAKSAKSPISEYTVSSPGYLFNHKISHVLQENDVKILHMHSPFTMGLYALNVGHILHMPVVATFHSKYYDDVYQVTKSKLLAKTTSEYIVDVYNKCDSVWTCSDGTANTLRSYGYKGDIFVINNGTDCEYPSNPEVLKQNAIERFKIDTTKPVILFVGHQIWQKNIKVNLDTAKILMERGFDFQMIFAGTGYAEKEIKKYAEEIGVLDKCVKFVGMISDREVLKGLELASDLMFFVSVYDNAPLVVREAASLKLPALLAKGSNAAEVVTDGINGFAEEVDPEKLASRIVSILSDKEKLKSIGEQSSNTIGIHWNKIVPIVGEKYNEIIEKYNFKHKKA
ncbi:MAG: glycosyltransferase, partial [Clostridia bacterium]|nr:glycosyltransferase [Clostridia bacterium]